MSGNRHPEAARRYHDATVHSPQSVRSGSRGLDWDTKPEPFKIYPGLAGRRPASRLSRAGSRRAGGHLDRARRCGPARPRAPGLAPLLLGRRHQAHELSGRRHHVLPRRAVNGGAVPDGGLRGRGRRRGARRRGLPLLARRLRAAAPARGRLPRRPRHRRCRRRPGRATGDADPLRHLLAQHLEVPGAGLPPPLLGLGLACSSNLLASATALDLPARAITGFVDLEVNGLLALDAEKEGALLLAPVGGQGRSLRCLPSSPRSRPR